MSQNKKIHQKHGYFQEDMVEILYYLYTGHASILNYLSTMGEILSTLITSLSAAEGSNSATVLSVSAIASFPTSMTDLCNVSIHLEEV